MDEIEHLVLAGAARELFKPRLGDERHLDVSACGKLNKSVAQAGVKTMQGALLRLFAANYRILIGGVHAERQHPRPSVAVKHQVLIGLDREHRQLLRAAELKDAIESTLAHLSHIHLEADSSKGRAEPRG